MAGDEGKKIRFFSLLSEIEKFSDPNNSQRLVSIGKKLGLSKQALNHHLKKLRDQGLIKCVQSAPFAIYDLTEKGESVKRILGHSEQGVKTALWRLHNIILGYRVQNWGSWRFGKTIPMNNWAYQELEKDGFKIHLQTTGLLKIYVPGMIGPDPEILRGKACSRAQDIATWFAGKYDARLSSDQLMIRKGQKQLLGSEQISKLLGRVKTGDFWIDASDGTENLEEPEDSYAVENILQTMQETPRRLDVVQEKVANVEKMLQGSLTTQSAIANAQNMAAAAILEGNKTLSELKNLLAGLLRPREATSQGQESPENDVLRPSDEAIARESHQATLEEITRRTRVDVKMLQDIEEFRFTDVHGLEHVLDINAGSIISIAADQALNLIFKGKAQRVRRD